MNFDLKIYDKVTSTQDVIERSAKSGAPEGIAALAFAQEQGRGRLGRSWVSPAGKNLALSFLLRPHCAPDKAALLGLLTAVTVCETLQELGLTDIGLKWPNDVLASSRKIAGVLSEASLSGGHIDYLIVGIGLNLNTVLEDFPIELRDIVTSYARETGRRADLRATAKSLLNRFEADYDRFATDGADFIIAKWKKLWAHRDCKVAVNKIEGIAKTIDDSGALILEENGRRTRITAGEVKLIDHP